MSIMKRLLLLATILSALATQVQADTIKAFATDVRDTYGTFSQAPGGTALTNTDLAGIISSDPATFVLGLSDQASIDLGFGDSNIVTGSGADLVIYTVGNGYTFGLQAFDTSGSMLSNYLYSVPSDGSSTAKNEDGSDACVIRNDVCAAFISATSIDLFNDAGFAIANDIGIDYIRLFIGNDYNGEVNNSTAYPLFSLAGALHTSDVAAVPIPLPIILFASGLSFLGWVGRRKHA